MEKDTVKILTPEHIELEYELPGLGTRFLGIIIDHLLQFGLLAVVWLVLILSMPNFMSDNFYDFIRSSFAAVLLVLMFIIFFGYFIFFETIWAGQTPGKKFAQTQVIKDNGEPVGFIESLLRNLFRTIDFMPFNYMLGSIFIIFHEKRKRVGDIVGGTVVVRLKPDLKPVVMPDLQVRTDMEIDIAGITDKEYGVVRNFIIRRNSLNYESRASIACKLAPPLMKKLGVSEKDMDYEEFLEAVATRYREYKKMI